MAQKRISYDQDRALAHGRSVARANQRRAVAARQRQEAADAARAAELAAEELSVRERLNGFYYGDRVASFDLCWRRPCEGVLVAGDGYGAWIEDDAGAVQEVNRYELKPVS